MFINLPVLGQRLFTHTHWSLVPSNESNQYAFNIYNINTIAQSISNSNEAMISTNIHYSIALSKDTIIDIINQKLHQKDFNSKINNIINE